MTSEWDYKTNIDHLRLIILWISTENDNKNIPKYISSSWFTITKQNIIDSAFNNREKVTERVCFIYRNKLISMNLNLTPE